MRNTMNELTGAMQRLCAVANRIVAQNGHASRIEIDLLLEDLRGLYDIALQLNGDALPEPSAARPADEPPVKDEAQMMAMMSTMAAMTTAEESTTRNAEPAEQEAKPAEQEEKSAEQQVEEVAQEPEPRADVPQAPVEPLPSMEELEQNGNELLFDEIILEPKAEESEAPAGQEPAAATADERKEERAEAIAEEAEEEPRRSAAAPQPPVEQAVQASLLDYLSQPAARTLGESLGAEQPQPSSLEMKVSDLRTVININDKFSFMSELFRNNMKAYNDFILHLNALQRRDEAMAYVQETAAQYKWDEGSAAVQSFYKIFDKKF